MDWILRNPRIQSAFSSLGHMNADAYQISANCYSTLEDILKNILTEDKYLRNYRRTISFAQHAQKDLLPLLLNCKDEKTIALLIKILMNLTIPVECLLSVDTASKCDFGRHTVFELKNLLTECKNLFVDARATKAVVDFLKKNAEGDQNSGLSEEQCENVINGLNLIRNVVHIFEDTSQKHKHSSLTSSVQNQIIWNIFSQGFDKVIIRLMTLHEAANWSETMVQLVALLYKDQHVGKIQKLLNVWLEASMSESSEDNESNTSPQNSGSASDSPMLTTDQTNSDSSDNYNKDKVINGKSKDIGFIGDTSEPTGDDATAPPSDNSIGSSDDETPLKKKYKLTKKDEQIQDLELNKWQGNDVNMDGVKETINSIETFQYQTSDVIISASTKLVASKKYENPVIRTKRSIEDRDKDSGIITQTNRACLPPPTKILKVQNKIKTTSENSDCGYGTQIETRESVSSSSNDDDICVKPVHMKPHHRKQKANTKARISTINTDDKRRKKLVKRGKSNILNVKGLLYHQPTDEDIALVMKEFTVDFMLKGYSSLVRTLHKQILNYEEAEIERSHFFWLVTYFLKFATQMELDIEHVESVLSFDVISFLTAEGVNLCEQFKLAVIYNGSELNACRRKLHLVVTAIREFVQSVDTFKKLACSSNDDNNNPLVVLQRKMWETDELRSLMVLLIRSYDSEHHDKQYLQDLVVTNHLLLLFLDNVIKLPGHTGKLNMIDHIKQFATPLVMKQYGVLLEDYQTNGEFVNDCVFTIMHHVGAEHDNLVSLYQPSILRTFASIRSSEYEICDQWTDLVEFVVNSFVRRPMPDMVAWPLTEPTSVRGDGCGVFAKPLPPKAKNSLLNRESETITSSGWTEREISCLSWNYIQSKNMNDVIGNIVNLYRVDCIVKERNCVVKELYTQGIIGQRQFKGFVKIERKLENSKSADARKYERTRGLCDQLSRQGYAAMLDWVKNVLLEICYVKICLAKNAAGKLVPDYSRSPSDHFISNKLDYVMSPVAYHSILVQKAIPLVPWNCGQAAICKDSKFLNFLANMDFEMPTLDSGNMFIRIPHTWTAEVLYGKAANISSVDKTKLKFPLSDIWVDSTQHFDCTGSSVTLMTLTTSKIPMLPIPNSCYRVHRFKQIGAMMQYTPAPGMSGDIDDAAMDDTPGNEKIDWLELVKKSQQNDRFREISKSLEPFKTIPESKECTDSIQTIKQSTLKHCQLKHEREKIIHKTNMKMNVDDYMPKDESLEPFATIPVHTTEKLLQTIEQCIVKHERQESEKIVAKSKRNQGKGTDVDIISMSEEESACDTESVASDFCRMYVSDEEDHTDILLRRSSFGHDDFIHDGTPTATVNVHCGAHAHSHANERHRPHGHHNDPELAARSDVRHQIAEVQKLTASVQAHFNALTNSIRDSLMEKNKPTADNGNKAIAINATLADNADLDNATPTNKSSTENTMRMDAADVDNAAHKNKADAEVLAKANET